jgi:hypothetical protein
MSAAGRLAAARARAAGFVDAADAAALDELSSLARRVVHATQGDKPVTLLGWTTERVLSTGEEVHPRRLPGVMQPLALLGVLLATRVPQAAHPWPGQQVTVGEVLATFGRDRLEEARVRHLKGALRALAARGLVALDDNNVADVAPVRVGIQVAVWDGPWIGELGRLLDELADVQLQLDRVGDARGQNVEAEDEP